MGLVTVDLKPLVKLLEPVAQDAAQTVRRFDAVGSDASEFLRTATALVRRIDRLISAWEAAIAAQQEPKL